AAVPDSSTPAGGEDVPVEAGKLERTSVSLWSRLPSARSGPEPKLRSCGYLSQPVGGSFPGERRSPYVPPPHCASACHASPAGRPIGQRGRREERTRVAPAR